MIHETIFFSALEGALNNPFAAQVPDGLLLLCVYLYVYTPLCQITELYFILQHKVWLKPSAEQQFLYGHNVLKTGLARISESTLKYQGIVVYSMNDIPLVSIFEIEININYEEILFNHF